MAHFLCHLGCSHFGALLLDFYFTENIKIATDLLGITILRYAQPDDIISGCKRICEKMKEEETINRIMLLPSTSLAISYYKNFLKPLGDVVSECKLSLIHI